MYTILEKNRYNYELAYLDIENLLVKNNDKSKFQRILKFREVECFFESVSNYMDLKNQVKEKVMSLIGENNIPQKM